MTPKREATPSRVDPNRCQHCRRPIKLPSGVTDPEFYWHTETSMFRCDVTGVT